MATNPIGYSGYADTYSLLQKAKGDSDTQKSDRKEEEKSESGSWKTRIRDQINSYLEDVPKGADGKLSFQDVDDYRKTLEDKWDAEVKADLKKLGVDTDKELPLRWDAKNSKVTVSDGHPDKETIEKYFEDNADKIQEFKDIIQLGKMTSASRSKFTPSELRHSIQQQSMAVWYEDNSDPTSWFSGGGLVLGQSQSMFTGLDIRV